MQIYIDTDFKCHVTDDGTMTAVENSFFDDKCDALIEGYRYVPDGEVWIREDGVEFRGEMISPWRDLSELVAAQKIYEWEQFQDMKNALNELGVDV